MAVVSSSSSSSSTSTEGGNKRQKLLLSSSSSSSLINKEEEEEESHDEQQQQQLLKGLPDHLAQLCLSSVPPFLLFSICTHWRRFLYSPSYSLSPHHSIYALFLLSHSDDDNNESEYELASLDPLAISSGWTPLPPSCNNSNLLLHHPSFISRQLPIQTASVAGKLVLLAGTDRSLRPALPNPLLFDPITTKWTTGPSLSSPRRWCAAGSADGRLYVASGVGSEYSSETSRSAEVWDLETTTAAAAKWTSIAALRDSRFSREPMEMVYCSGKGKLCMLDRKTKEGAIYNIRDNTWEDMPPRMAAGWTGPAAATETIHVVDERSGFIKRYVWERDTWTYVRTNPLHHLKGSVAVATWRGNKLIVAGDGGRRLTVVDVDKAYGRTWDLPIPEGKRLVALHVLPRMSRED